MNIYQEANELVYFLSLPEAHAKKGRTYCQMSALILTITISGFGGKEAEERLTKHVTEIKAKLGAK